MLSELVTLSALDEGSKQSFKVRAYENAGLGLEGDGRDITTLSLKELIGINGVGKATASKVIEFVETGKVEKLEALRAAYPPDFVELSRIPGLGPKTLLLVRSELGVENVEQLKQAIADEKLRELPGLGETSEAKISKAIERLGLTGKDRRTPIADALPWPSAWWTTCERFPRRSTPSSAAAFGGCRRRSVTSISPCRRRSLPRS